MAVTTDGTNIRELRVKRAWSQEQLADIAGVNVRTIQRIEHGDGASFESLKAVANAFGVDVGELLAGPTPAPASQPVDKKPPQQRVIFLGRVRRGRELFNVVGGAGMFSYENDDVDGDDVELIAEFFQDIRDWGDLWGDIEPADRVRVPHQFNARITELEERGLWVFAGSERQAYSFSRPEKSEIIKLNTAFVIIVKKDNRRSSGSVTRTRRSRSGRSDRRFRRPTCALRRAVVEGQAPRGWELHGHLHGQHEVEVAGPHVRRPVRRPWCLRHRRHRRSGIGRSSS